MNILGLESSCDETAAAVVTDGREVLSSVVASQFDIHERFGGVVPELASREHLRAIVPVVEQSLAQANVPIHAVAVTQGPGLIGALLVGITFAKAFALARKIPLIAVNHLEGHALTVRFTDKVEFPYLLLLVSGGHCQLLGVEGVGRYRRLATTIDDAVGEAFDKSAKVLGLGFPGGQALERAAHTGNPARFPLPRPLVGSDEPHFSFAGLKSVVLRARATLAEPTAQDIADLAASFQQAACDCLTNRTARAIAAFPEATALVVAGGVAANQAIRATLAGLAATHGLPFVAPPMWLCTDNGAMIAWAGLERLAIGDVDDLHAPARPRWPLDPAAEAVRGAGVKA